MIIKVGKGITFKDYEEASYFFGWDCHKNIKGNPKENAKTFQIEGDYFAWFPPDVTGEKHPKGWINEWDKNKITVTDPRGETKLKEREDEDRTRKFVTFAPIDKKQTEYEFIGIFKFVSRDGNKFIYKKNKEFPWIKPLTSNIGDKK